MKQQWKKWHILAVFLLTLVLLPAGKVHAATKYPGSVKFNKKSVTALAGTSVKLKAAISPKKVKYAKLTWSSSDPLVASVSASGKVTIRKTGTATITVKTANGKKAVCKVTGVNCMASGGKVKAVTPQGIRTYRAYSQNIGGYYRAYGCVTTAVSIASSVYGKNYSPKTIHTGSASKKYSEKYAVKKLKASASLSNKAAVSVLTASQILTDLKIPNRAVYTYTPECAVREIRSHLKQGKPVIAKVTNAKHDGIMLANGHHAIVLVAEDEAGYLTWIDPDGGRVRYAHGSGKYCKLTLEDLVQYHMAPAEGNCQVPYVTNLKAAGGYILVG